MLQCRVRNVHLPRPVKRIGTVAPVPGCSSALGCSGPSSGWLSGAGFAAAAPALASTFFVFSVLGWQQQLAQMPDRGVFIRD